MSKSDDADGRDPEVSVAGASATQGPKPEPRIPSEKSIPVPAAGSGHVPAAKEAEAGERRAEQRKTSRFRNLAGRHTFPDKLAGAGRVAALDDESRGVETQAVGDKQTARVTIRLGTKAGTSRNVKLDCHRLEGL